VRTTVNIDDHLLERAKLRARGRGTTLGDVLEEALQVLLAMPESSGARRALPSFDGGGFLPGIDPHSNASLLDEDEDERELRRQAGLD
jgi:hypothetical protein